jgi:hypothetical protein
MATSCQLLQVNEWIADDGDGHPVQTTPANLTVRDLAHDLDHLERYIERYGSIVAEQPSVWGQARLTKYREEFEQQMQLQVTKFGPTLQGSLSRSDQAYAADALSLAYTAQAVAGGGAAPGATSSSSSSVAGPTPPAMPNAFGAFDTMTRTPVSLPAPLGFGATGKAGLSLEPTVYLDQMKRYIDHLHELRRINDGDDTADSPGYSLNLVRIPVSVLPGRKTQEGAGAEITLTLRPHLHPELLPMTFHNLVTNDLVDLIGVPLTEIINDADCRAHLKAELQASAANSRAPNVANQRQMSALNRIWVRTKVKLGHSGSITKLRNAQRPFPASQIPEIYGEDEWNALIGATYKQFLFDVPNKSVVHYPDVQGYLQEQLSGAYRFLNDPSNIDLWGYCDPGLGLVSAIRGRRVHDLAALRSQFETAFQKRTGLDPGTESACLLAWSVVVDSALLNAQLVEDMKNAPAARGGFHLPTEWLPYYMPNPPNEAREAFNEYVHCRWPIHVFALDPEADQQNIADTFSSRREMQLAMSLAFVSGQLSANNLYRFARRLETEMETISLNNTAVGFSHGNETFGWRFYPRFQTPDTETNLGVCVRDLLIGGPNRKALLKQRRIEPGIRECVAIVLMPSFVPYATLDTSSNWFALFDPRRKAMDSERAIELSARVKGIQNEMPMVSNAACYRDGELERLMRRTEQLESRLPLQTLSVQVPYENTLGGFAMFNTGITNLSPELLGWYGSPGVNLDGSTTVFLIGNHFSVHQTRVLIGGQEITNAEMLSRQVMKVTIPANALALVEKTGNMDGGYSGPDTTTPTSGRGDPSKVDDFSGGNGQQSKDNSLVAASFDTPPPAPGVTAPNAPEINPPASSSKPTTPGSSTSGTSAPGSGAPPTPKPPAPTPAAPKEFLYVDVQLATPYGTTSHLLIPAWHFKTSGLDSPPSPGSGGGGSGKPVGSDASSSGTPGWTPANLSVGFVYSGLGIAVSDPPNFAPATLSINVGSALALSDGDVVTLKLKFESPATGDLKPVPITVATTGAAANYDATKHILKIAGNDFSTLMADLITPLQTQFGSAASKPPVATKVDTTLTVTGQPDTPLAKPLIINWVQAPAKILQATTPPAPAL